MTDKVFINKATTSQCTSGAGESTSLIFYVEGLNWVSLDCTREGKFFHGRQGGEQPWNPKEKGHYERTETILL